MFARKSRLRYSRERALQNLTIFFCKFYDICNFFLLKFHENCCFFKPIFCENFEIAAVEEDANLVELEKCSQTHIFLQNFVLIQPRTSPPKICKIYEKCIFEKCIFEKCIFEKCIFEKCIFSASNGLRQVPSCRRQFLFPRLLCGAALSCGSIVAIFSEARVLAWAAILKM